MWTYPLLTSLHSPPCTLRTASLQTPPAHGLSAMEAAERVCKGVGGSVSQPSHACQVPQQDRVAATTSRGWKTHLALATFPHRLTSWLGLPGITSHTNDLHSNLSLRVSIWYNEHQCRVLLGVRGAKIRRVCAEKTHNLTGKAIYFF